MLDLACQDLRWLLDLHTGLGRGMETTQINMTLETIISEQKNSYLNIADAKFRTGLVMVWQLLEVAGQQAAGRRW